MSCSIPIVIPSHKRADRVVSKKLVENPIICVAESQAAEYREYNPECEIVTHPDDVVGLIPKRNWMANHFGDLFMMDDDVYTIRKIYKPGGDTEYAVKDPKEATAIIDRLYRTAVLMDVHLFGFSNKVRPVMFHPFQPYSLSNCVTGCAYGVRKSPYIKWNEKMKLKEDFWISCWVKYNERMILVDHRYNFSQKDTMVNPGGLSSIRNEKTERESILLLKRYFGDCVVMKKHNGQYADKREINISVNFPF